jgi:ABC-type antimicrobial peptide transport system permease subunit
MGTIGHVLLLAFLIVLGLFSLGNGIFSDDAFCRWYKGKEPKPSGADLFIRWIGYLFLGILFEVAFSFSWKVYLPFFALALLLTIVFAAIYKRRRDAQLQKNTARLG